MRQRYFRNLRTFVVHLNLYCWNFFEHESLKCLIERKCRSGDLKAKMAGYDDEIQALRRRITVFNFIKYGRYHLTAKIGTIPPRFRSLVMEQDINPDSYTLADLENFRMDTCSNLKLSEWALQVYFVQHNCVIVEWIFPEEISETLVCFYSNKNGQELLKSYHVESVSIDKQSLFSVSKYYECNV